MSTMDLLQALEGERQIQSAEQVFDRAKAAGRDASPVRKLPHPVPAINDQIRDLLRH